jgi:hypothetical protein
LGRRRKTGYEDRNNHNTICRINALNKLDKIHYAVMGDWSWNHSKSELFKELAARLDKDCPHCVKVAHEEPAYLICNYLNSDDVMKILGCNRRTALDYLQTLRDILRHYTRI